MHTNWIIKLKIVDRKLKAQHKKCVLTNIVADVPTELLDGVWSGIGRELIRFDYLQRVKMMLILEEKYPPPPHAYLRYLTRLGLLK